jgi:hypothetical protein
VPFTDTVLSKAIALSAASAVGAGVAATGGAAATHYLGAHPTALGTYYGETAYDHSDPYHNDPGGERIRIEASPTIGTASVNFNILGPSD